MKPETIEEDKDEVSRETESLCSKDEEIVVINTHDEYNPSTYTELSDDDEYF